MMIATDLLPSTNKALKKKEQIIIHCMGEYIIDEHENHWSAINYLKHIGLSAHYLICPSGLAIQCALDCDVAYHCKNYNYKSLGIEFLVPGIHDYTSFKKAIKKPYLSHVQAVSGHKIITGWCKAHNLTSADIYLHSELNPNKRDPGFSWKDLQNMVRQNESG